LSSIAPERNHHPLFLCLLGCFWFALGILLRWFVIGFVVPFDMSLKSGLSIIFGAVMTRAKIGAILGLSIAVPLGIGGNLIGELGHGNKFKGISTLLSHPSIYLESFIVAPLIGGLLGFMSALLYLPVALVGWFLVYISNRMPQFQWLPLSLYWLAQLLFAAFLSMFSPASSCLYG